MASKYIEISEFVGFLIFTPVSVSVFFILNNYSLLDEETLRKK